MSEEVPENADGAIRGWIVAIGFTLVLTGGELMIEKEGVRFWTGLGLAVAGLPCYLSAAWWGTLKPQLNVRFVSTLGEVATDARWWISAGFVFLLSIAFVNGPTLILSQTISQPEGHYVVSEAIDSYFDGRPLGIWWDGVVLETTGTSNAPSDSLVANLMFSGKNLGNEEITLTSAYIISGIDSSKIPMKINVLPSDWIDISDAAPIPVRAQFLLLASFAPPTGSGMPEGEFLKIWNNFYVVIEGGGQKIRRKMEDSVVRGWIERKHPELAPHVTKRK